MRLTTLTLMICVFAMFTACKSSSSGSMSCSDQVTPVGKTTDATVSSSLAGSYNLTYNESSPGGPFADGASISVKISEDGILEVDGKSFCNPVYRVYSGTANEHEVIWYDEDTGFEYAASDNQGSFNEVNVGDAANPQNGFPKFLGQIR